MYPQLNRPMERARFEAIGTRARWRILYDDLFRFAQIDQVITYKEIADLLGTSDRHIVQAAARRAGKELEETELHAIDSIPNVGYRIVKPEEHLLLAKRHQKRSSRALARGSSKVTHVDMSAVPPELRQAFEMVGRSFAIQMEINRRLSVGHKQLKAAIEMVDEKVDRESARTVAEVTELRARLAALEASTATSAA